MVASIPLSFRRSRGVLRPALPAGALLLVSACTPDSEPLFEQVEPLVPPTVSRPGNLPTFPAPGSGGRGATGAASDGVRGEAIAGLIGADAGIGNAATGAPDAGALDGGAPCQSNVDCEDGNECTENECSQGFCRNTARAAGFACGDPEQRECSQPDSCDGAGRCVPNHALASTPCGRGVSAGCTADACDGAGECRAVDVPAGTPCGDDGGGCAAPTCDGAGLCDPRAGANGSACPGGSCTLGACVAGQAVGCPAELASEVPVQLSWSSTGRPNLVQGSCGSANTPDFALVFSAPSAGDYRIDASGTPDSVLVVRAGSCSSGNELGCNDDRNEDNRDSRLELRLSAGQTITIYVSQFDPGSSGAGTLRISLL